MMQMILVLSILGNSVVSLTAIIPPDYVLQDVDYLCNGSLKSNTTVVLDGGEHHISTTCTISNIDNVTIMGSSINSTTIRCEEGSGLQFVSVQQLTIERMTFISCGIILTDTENTDYFSSAVTMRGSTGNVSITNCSFQNNSADEGGAVLLDGPTDNVSITNCTFQNKSATDGDGGAVRLVGSTGNVSITNCTFQNNSATYGNGGAVRLVGSTGNVSITNCTFQNNSATYGGAVWLDGSTGNASFTNCTFQNNSATYGDGGAVRLVGSTGNVSITKCTFQNNSATYGDGGAVRLVGSAGNVSITNCTFQNNSATDGGAVMLSSAGYVSITHCTFQNNSATFDGGAIYITLAHVVIIDKSTFINNTAVRGAAVYASNTYNGISIIQSGYLTLQEVIVENNHCSSNGYPMIRGGAIYFSAMTVDIIGDTITGSHFLSNSPLGAITGENGFLQLYGNVSFYDNKGENGGAISLSNNVVLTFNDSCTVEFSGNVATGYGGAIYSDGGPSSKNRALDCTIVFFADSMYNVRSSITFTDNHAQQGGHAVYATPIYECTCIQTFQYSSTCENLTSYFTIIPLPQDLNDIKYSHFQHMYSYVIAVTLTCAMSQVSMKERLPHILVGL